MEHGQELLKQDLLGRVLLVRDTAGRPLAVLRDTRRARWWTRWAARRLAGREARALTHIAALVNVPRLLSWDGEVLTRSFIDGQPMQLARPLDTAYFRDALRLLVQVHRSGVVHNDAAKEPNWLVASDGSPALIDFQLAGVFAGRGRLFRLLAREDLRHLLKHKRTYCPQALTARQRRMLARPSWFARVWMSGWKPLYLWFTRRVLRWEDREGAADRRIG